MAMKVPEHIDAITPYPPGKPTEALERELGIKDSIKLASNENPLGPSPRALEAARTALETVNRYPDGGAYYLREKLANLFDRDMDEIVLGNGSNELIDMIVRVFIESGDEAIMSDQAFIIYQMSVQCAGGRNVVVAPKRFGHDLQAMADGITERTRILFIANPNNPTGTICTRAEFEAFLARVPEDVLVMMDEAYFEYVTDPEYPDSLAYQRRHPNIVTLRTFSKIHGLAGLRLGYAIADRAIVEVVNKVRAPFNVNSVAQAAAMAAVDDNGHIEEAREMNAQGLETLAKGFQALGLDYVPSHANFILVDVGRDGGEVYGKLLHHGVIVRPMKGYGLPEHLRVTVGTQAENDRALKAFGEVLGGTCVVDS